MQQDNSKSCKKLSAPRVPSPKAVADFKRVCDDMGLELRDDEEAEQAIATIKAALEIEEPAPVPPRDDV